MSYIEWARQDFIIGVIKSKMERVNLIALVAAEHTLCLWLRGAVFKFTRHMWKATIDENAEIIVNEDRMNRTRKDSCMAEDIAMALIPYLPKFVEVIWLIKSNSLYLR